MTPFKSNIALLTRDSVVVLNSSAKEVARLEHNYSDPDMAVYKGRALVYDRTSGDFTLMNSSKILGDGNTGSPIYTAAMGKDGTVAFSLKTSAAQSELCVYNHPQVRKDIRMGVRAGEDIRHLDSPQRQERRADTRRLRKRRYIFAPCRAELQKR